MRRPAIQRRFLRWFLSGPADRRAWIDTGRHTLGPVEDLANPPPEAAGVLVYRLSDANGLTFKGARIASASISLAGLRALADCWAEPLATLNETGLEAANAPALAEEMEKRSFDLPRAMDKRLVAAARAAGQDVAPYLRDLLDLHLGGEE